jgi:hypothetical protein
MAGSLFDDIKGQDVIAVPKIFKHKKTNTSNTSKTYKKLTQLAINKKPIYSSQKQLKYNNTNNIKIYNKPSTSNIYINAWVNMHNNILKPRNFGDDINISFLNLLFDNNIKLYKKEQHQTNYLFIGSVLIDKFVDSKTIVWGTGMLKPQKLTNKPSKVYAVRGPKTRKILLDSGISCPEIYGDPALLLPYYYYPYI